MTRTNQLIARIEHYSGKWWYLPLVSILAGADLFVGFIPSDGLLVTTVLLRPKHWLRSFIWLTAGATLGSLGLAAAIQHWGGGILESILSPETLQSSNWKETENAIARFGAPALSLIAATPLPQQPVVVICALAAMPLYKILLAVLVGRGLKNFVLAWSATHAPKLFRKFKGVHKETIDIQKELKSKDTSSH